MANHSIHRWKPLLPGGPGEAAGPRAQGRPAPAPWRRRFSVATLLSAASPCRSTPTPLRGTCGLQCARPAWGGRSPQPLRRPVSIRWGLLGVGAPCTTPALGLHGPSQHRQPGAPHTHPGEDTASSCGTEGPLRGQQAPPPRCGRSDPSTEAPGRPGQAAHTDTRVQTCAPHPATPDTCVRPPRSRKRPTCPQRPHTSHMQIRMQTCQSWALCTRTTCVILLHTQTRPSWAPGTPVCPGRKPAPAPRHAARDREVHGSFPAWHTSPAGGRLAQDPWPRHPAASPGATRRGRPDRRLDSQPRGVPGPGDRLDRRAPPYHGRAAGCGGPSAAA